MPCLAGCMLHVEDGVARIDGPSRDRVFDQARRFFRAHARKLPALQVAATLSSPRTAARPSIDTWSIIVNSDVTFSATGIAADIRPALRVVENDDAPRQTILSAG